MKVSIIGSGAMGSGIAQVAATAGCEVVVFDTNPASLKKAQEKLTKILARLVEKKRITPDESSKINTLHTFTENLDQVTGSELVIEAIIENLEIKKQVFADLEKRVDANCVLASNTSSLSIASIASACKHQERVIGIHFFNPAPLMPLVEIIPAICTSDSVTTLVQEIIKGWGKTIVLAKDTPGFIVNKVARPFYGEALRIYEEGIADFATIDWAMKNLGGFKMGPFELMDFIGNDINYKVTESVFQAFYSDPRYKPAFTQRRLSEAGWLGRKSGRGYYNYAEGSEKPNATEDAELGKKILNRILCMLINEAADTLFWNIASKEHIDLAVTKGVNYPKGLFKWADEIGIDTVCKQLSDLYNEYLEDRYRTSPLLKRMLQSGQKFYS